MKERTWSQTDLGRQLPTESISKSYPHPNFPQNHNTTPQHFISTQIGYLLSQNKMSNSPNFFTPKIFPPTNFHPPNYFPPPGLHPPNFYPSSNFFIPNHQPISSCQPMPNYINVNYPPAVVAPQGFGHCILCNHPGHDHCSCPNVSIQPNGKELLVSITGNCAVSFDQIQSGMTRLGYQYRGPSENVSPL